MSSPPSITNSPTRRTVIILHPDLGIGGAERLILDAALSLQSPPHSNRIIIYTSHCDPAHSFDEAHNGTLDVRVRGNSIFPATVFGRFKILMTILRQLCLVLWCRFSGEWAKLMQGEGSSGEGEVVFLIDQLSACIPLLRYLYPETRILFYCHFPDLLLVKNRGSLVKRAWRWGFDKWEGWSMKGADRVVVNSEFTRGVVEKTWPGLGRERGLGVVYPCVETSAGKVEGEVAEDGRLWEDKKVILSINRFERKKDIGLALRAFAGLNAQIRQGARLVVAGGYDNRVAENVEYHSELVALADTLKLSSATATNIVTAQSIPATIQVVFLLSVPAQLKTMLLHTARLLVYTPTNEHFGIVPLEAMLAGVPVLAASSGGPLETVVDGETGWLRDVEKTEQWTGVMEQVMGRMGEKELNSMGQKGRERVLRNFSREEMGCGLQEEIEEMLAVPRSETIELQDILLLLGMVAIVPYSLVFAFYLRVRA